MGEKKKIYLSLDDLNKLYGISPALINIIKNKSKRRTKRRARKINNSTMGNKPSSSDHMVGSSSALSVATQQLNQSNINKRIEDINRNNLMIENENKNKSNLMIEDKKDKPTQEEIQLKNIQKIYNKFKNKEILTDDELDEYEKMQNTLFPTQTSKAKRKSNVTRRKTFIPEPMTNPLASTQSNVMGRTESYNNIKISDDDSAGTNVIGTSSDNFVNQNVEEFLPTETNTEPIEDPNSFLWMKN